ncbi:efflux RND transporter periplasmic adaptor subunit [Sessilibacter sp. MAH1]
MNNLFSIKSLLLVSVGAVVGIVGYSLLATLTMTAAGGSADAADDEPLYWVAPMDPNFRRDGPGKSPMGMDLIPVYANAQQSQDVGTVQINSQIVNSIGVRTSRAVVRNLPTEIQTVGYVTYDEDQLVHMHPRVEGWIEKLYIKAAGDPVEKGEPVYSLYSPQLVTAQEELLLALNRNNTPLIKAAEERLKALQVPEGFIAKIKKQRKIENNVIFSAPQSGIIDNLNIREGFYIKPGLTLLSIVNLDSVWVEAEVFERQARLIEVGEPVIMTLGFDTTKEWAGEVDYIYPVLDEKMRTLRVRLKFKNPEYLLKPNMFADVKILGNSKYKALTVEKSAVIRTGDQARVVLAKGNGEFKSVEVNIGRVEGEYTEILSGIYEGEKVVTAAQFLLDSESSKTSDFKRLDSDVARKPSIAETRGEILEIDAENNQLTIHREAIEKWNRPAATVDFILEAPYQIQDFAKGDSLTFKFLVSSGEFIILDILDHKPSDLLQGMNAHENMTMESKALMSSETMDSKSMNLEAMSADKAKSMEDSTMEMPDSNNSSNEHNHTEHNHAENNGGQL